MAGTPNKATKEFRETVTKLLSDNADNVALWLERVAVGVEPVLDAEGNVARKGVPPDPAKALDLLASLAEFAAPKLSRTELTGKDGGPVQYSKVKRTIVDPALPKP
ncbi:hypothetical protein SAMN03159371_00130 [Variovorax sp. NFACC28]|nr:hypothetical protein SAMN03159371_00130 [Variovorax sp. NFACC28]